MITFPYEGLKQRFEDEYNREKVYRPHTVAASLFYRDESFGIGAIPFDLLIDESHSIEFDISDHAVENGGSVSDHVQERLRSVQITGMFTNHPIGERNSGYVDYGSELADGTVEVGTEPDIVNVDGVQGSGNEALDMMFESVKELARMREPVRVVTSLEVYPEMVVESLDYDRGPDDGESIKFTMKLREVRTARVSTVMREGVWNPPEPKAQDTDAQKKLADNKKKGKVTGEEQATNRLKDGLKGEVTGSFETDDVELVLPEVEV